MGNETTVYCITNKINGMRYIGHTRIGLERRMKAHTYGKLAVDLEMRRIGLEHFEIRGIESVDSRAAYQTERSWITMLDTRAPKGYNVSVSTGNRPGFQRGTGAL